MKLRITLLTENNTKIIETMAGPGIAGLVKLPDKSMKRKVGRYDRSVMKLCSVFNLLRYNAAIKYRMKATIPER